MKTLADLPGILAFDEATLLKSHIDMWKLSPEAVGALVEVFLAAHGKDISVAEILRTWAQYDLNLWVAGELVVFNTDKAFTAACIAKVYNDLRLSPPNAQPAEV